MIQPTCSTCYFYRQQSCHRFPPQVDHKTTGIRRFPDVGSEDWCGEYRQHPNARQPKYDVEHISV